MQLSGQCHTALVKLCAHVLYHIKWNLWIWSYHDLHIAQCQLNPNFLWFFLPTDTATVGRKTSRQYNLFQSALLTKFSCHALSSGSSHTKSITAKHVFQPLFETCCEANQNPREQEGLPGHYPMGWPVVTGFDAWRLTHINNSMPYMTWHSCRFPRSFCCTKHRAHWGRFLWVQQTVPVLAGGHRLGQ